MFGEIRVQDPKHEETCVGSYVYACDWLDAVFTYMCVVSGKL